MHTNRTHQSYKLDPVSLVYHVCAPGRGIEIDLGVKCYSLQHVQEIYFVVVAALLVYFVRSLIYQFVILYDSKIYFCQSAWFGSSLASSRGHPYVSGPTIHIGSSANSPLDMTIYESALATTLI
jgi:hypothetical protein